MEANKAQDKILEAARRFGTPGFTDAQMSAETGLSEEEVGMEINKLHTMRLLLNIDGGKHAYGRVPPQDEEWRRQASQ